MNDQNQIVELDRAKQALEAGLSPLQREMAKVTSSNMPWKGKRDALRKLSEDAVAIFGKIGDTQVKQAEQRLDAQLKLHEETLARFLMTLVAAAKLDNYDAFRKLQDQLSEKLNAAYDELKAWKGAELIKKLKEQSLVSDIEHSAAWFRGQFRALWEAAKPDSTVETTT